MVWIFALAPAASAAGKPPAVTGTDPSSQGADTGGAAAR